MFDQTFVPVTHDAKKPYMMLASVGLEITALAVMILVPLIYTQTLPQARLKSIFAGPLRPAPQLPRNPDARKPTGVQVIRIAAVTYFPRLFKNPVVSQPIMDAPPDAPIAAVGSGPFDFAGALDPSLPSPAPPQAPAAAKTPVERKLRIASMQESQLIRRVQPDYPSIAKTARIQGAVVFTAIIGKAGVIENLKLVSGHPMLVEAASRAILQWRYKPTLLNGEPVEVITNIQVNFILNQP